MFKRHEMTTDINTKYGKVQLSIEDGKFYLKEFFGFQDRREKIEISEEKYNSWISKK